MPSPAIRILAVACGVVLTAGLATAATYDETTSDLEQAATEPTSGDASSTTSIDEGAATSTTESSIAESVVDEPVATAPPSSAAPETTAPTTSTTVGSPAAVIGTTPGTYRYDTTGTANGKNVSGTSTLEVAPAQSDGTQPHVQSTPEGTTTTIYRHTDEGTYLESLALESDEGSFTLEATTPYLLVPTGAAAGTSTRGVLEGDGVTAEITFTVVEITDETTTATLDVELSGTIRGFEVEGTMNSTVVARSSDQLPLDTHAKSDIVVGGGLFRMQSDTRSVLRR